MSSMYRNGVHGNAAPQNYVWSITIVNGRKLRHLPHLI
jgi:hypothetical protein